MAHQPHPVKVIMVETAIPMAFLTLWVAVEVVLVPLVRLLHLQAQAMVAMEPHQPYQEHL